MPRSYATPLAFKTAVEQRLRNEAEASGMDLQRRRQLFVFDRFLARLFRIPEDAVVLKGGLVIELRLERARKKKTLSPLNPGAHDRYQVSSGVDHASAVQGRHGAIGARAAFGRC